MSKYNFLANKEWNKDVKFNGKWFHLASLFDQDQSNYDFNNDTASDLDYVNNDTDFINLENFDKFDFNNNIDFSQGDKFDFNEESLDELTLNTNNALQSESSVIARAKSIINSIVNSSINFVVEYEPEIKNDDTADLVDNISINKNIAGHQIEQYIADVLKSKMSDVAVYYHNYDGTIKSGLTARWRGKIRNLEDTTISDIIIVDPVNNFYFIEVKSAEQRKNDGLDLTNIKIHSHQEQQSDIDGIKAETANHNLWFALINYKIIDNTIKITNADLVHGSNINLNHK